MSGIPESPEGPFLHGQSPFSVPPQTQWQPVAEHEDEIRQRTKGEIDRIERAYALGQRTLVLKGSPGFDPFVQAIEDLRTHAKNQMVDCTAGNEQLRILQGRCQAFGSILALMRNTERNLQTLAQQLEAAKQKAAVAIRPDGRVVPEPVGGVR